MLRVLVFFIAVASYGLTRIERVDSHEESGEWHCDSDPGIRIQAEFKPGIITLDGHVDDWKDIDGSEFSLLPALDPDADKEYNSGKMTLKVILKFFEVQTNQISYLSVFMLTFGFHEWPWVLLLSSYLNDAEFMFSLTVNMHFFSVFIFFRSIYCRWCMMGKRHFSCCRWMGTMHILKGTVSNCKCNLWKNVLVFFFSLLLFFFNQFFWYRYESMSLSFGALLFSVHGSSLYCVWSFWKMRSNFLFSRLV